MTARIERRADRERDERYQRLVELAPDGIFVHDGERIVLANAAALRLAGTTHREELVGWPIDTFLDPPYLKAIETQLTDPVEGSDDVPDVAPPVRDVFHRIDGSDVEVEVRAVAFMDRGRPSAHLVVRDITERLAMEQATREVAERLQQAQKMDAVGALAGGVAHEVNNMMSVILGFGAFLLKDQAEPAERLADVREIMKAADRAATITRQLLAFSLRAVHRPRVVDLGAALRAVRPMVQQLLGGYAELVTIADDAPSVWVDPGQLEQVLVNLALNARDAMPAGGTLTMAAGLAEIPIDTRAAGGVTIPPGQYATVLVRDTGTGMDAQTLARIFEPFFTTKAVGMGTGLGLAAAHGIVAQNGGYVTVESALGLGAAFTLYLPIVPASDRLDRRRGPPRLSAGSANTGATVLVVDDEPAVRAVVVRSLRHAGFSVLDASDGIEALELIERLGPPQIVLTDTIMPRLGGVDLALRLRERWPAIPVLFISGYSAAELRRQGVVESDRDAIQKPFLPDELVGGVIAALARAAEAAEAAEASDPAS